MDHHDTNSDKEYNDNNKLDHCRLRQQTIINDKLINVIGGFC